MIHGHLARATAVTLAAPALALALAWAPGGAAQPLCAAAGTAHAAVVVQYGDGRPSTSQCVAFGGSMISGEGLLRAANISFATVYYPSVGGDAICQVNGEPPTPSGGWNQDNCIGPSTTIYWGIFSAPYGGDWSPSSGISTLTFHDGDGEGLRFTNSPANKPPPASTANCPPPQPIGGGTSGGGTGSGSGAGGGSAGSASGPARGQGTNPGTPGSTTGSSTNPTPGSSPDAGAASANPGEVALGGSASPAPSGALATPLLATGGSSLLGIGAAGLVAVGLIALLVVQLVVPRLRR